MSDKIITIKASDELRCSIYDILSSTIKHTYNLARPNLGYVLGETSDGYFSRTSSYYDMYALMKMNTFVACRTGTIYRNAFTNGDIKHVYEIYIGPIIGNYIGEYKFTIHYNKEIVDTIIFGSDKNYIRFNGNNIEYITNGTIAYTDNSNLNNIANFMKKYSIVYNEFNKEMSEDVEYYNHMLILSP